LAIRQLAVVPGAKYPVADRELEAAVEPELLATKPALRIEQCAGDGVELCDVGAPVGDHHADGEIRIGGLPPVGEQPRLRLRPVVGDIEPTLCGRVGKVVAALPSPQQGERPPFELVVLTAILRQLDRAFAFDDGGVEAAGADGGKLRGVADQDELRVRVLGLPEQTGERARVGHPRLVDHH
jgi:hypothetical protein